MGIIVEQPWSVPFAVDDIPDTGEHIDLEAPEARLDRTEADEPQIKEVWL